MEPADGPGRIEIRGAYSGDALESVRRLFIEYAEWLGFSLAFQGFDEELAGLPGAYSPPSGRLLLAMLDRVPVGCVGLRPLADPGTGELKRLYVVPWARGRGFARALATQALGSAVEIGYERVLLDTLECRMPQAIALYGDLGFVRTEAYCPNPFDDAAYYELRLPASPGGKDDS